MQATRPPLPTLLVVIVRTAEGEQPKSEISAAETADRAAYKDLKQIHFKVSDETTLFGIVVVVPSKFVPRSIRVALGVGDHGVQSQQQTT